MARKNKLKRFADLLSFPNVYENFSMEAPSLSGKDGKEVELKGQWKEKHFNNNNPITLELACGGGEYAIGLAQLYPERNFIGVDIKGARIWKGAKQALEKKLTNVAFLRTRIELIQHFFEAGEISEIWITFPDPFLRKSKANRRLTSPYFLNLYRHFLPEGSLIHLKTDSLELYEFTLQTIEDYPNTNLLYEESDIYSKPLIMPELELKTRYEQMHLENDLTIKYIRFQLH